MADRPDERGLEVPNLREWRKRAAVTQAELAERSGVSRATISSAEGGARIWPSHVRALADALGTTPADLQERPPDGKAG